MKKVLIFLSIIITAFVSKAQQAPFHKQYYVNPFVLNPALAGDEDMSNLYLMHRNQWTGLPGAPVTSTITFDSPIIHGINGVGISLFTDHTGIFRRTGGSAVYSHQIYFNDNMKISLGAGVNVFDNRIDFNKVQVVQDGDPYVFQNIQNKPVLDGTGGLNFRWSKLDFGASIRNFGFSKLTYKDNLNTASYRQEMFLQGSLKYKFYFGGSKQFAAIPLVVFRYFDQSPSQYDLNGIIEFKDKYWLAGTYRSDYGISIAAGLRLYDRVTAGYSYDIITNNMRGMTGMSSEIIVGIKFGKTKEQKQVEWIDSDNDGVADEFDLESNTEPGAFVNFQGITIKNRVLLESRDTLIIREIIYLDSGKREMITQVLSPDNNYRQSFFFDYDRSNLKKDQENKFVDLVKYLRENPGTRMVVIGHADSRGTDEYNLILGQRRAQTVAKELAEEYGIDPNMIQIITKGKNEPLAEGRSSVNRRVDVEMVPTDVVWPTNDTPGVKKENSKTGTNDSGSTEEDRTPMYKIDRPYKGNGGKYRSESYSFNSSDVDGSEPEGDGIYFEDLLNPGMEQDELFFSVQLGVFRNKIDKSYWQNITPLYQVKIEDGTTRYFSGVFISNEFARERLKDVLDKGFNDAFVTAYFNGQRISVEEAKEILKVMGPGILRKNGF